MKTDFLTDKTLRLHYKGKSANAV